MKTHAQRCLLAFLLLAGARPGAARAASTYFVLENGLQVLLEERPGVPLTAMALSVDLGTKDESEATSGYAHLLEHMLLFGAGEAGSSEARQGELRGHGIEINAHTDHDLMTFELSCPADEGVWALERLRQTAFSARLDPEHLEEEKRIIGEEIRQLRDNPGQLGRLLLMERLFAGHPYGRPVFGDGSAIHAATAEKLQAFYAPRLVPDRCALAIVGGFALAAMEAEVRHTWGSLARGSTPAAVVPDCGGLGKSSEQRVELDVQECHLFIGWMAPAFNDGQRLPFSLLTHLLGGGLNPILNGVLCGGRRLADHVSMGFAPMRNGGMAVLHMVLEEKNVRSAVNEVASFLSQIGSFHFSPEDVPPAQRLGMLDYLQSAKNQMEYGSGTFRESVLNLSVSAARFLLLNRNDVKATYLESVEKVSSGDLRRAAGKYLSGRKWVVLAITPLAHKVPAAETGRKK